MNAKRAFTKYEKLSIIKEAAENGVTSTLENQTKRVGKYEKCVTRKTIYPRDR